MIDKIFSSLSTGRRYALVISVLWLTALTLVVYPFVLRKAPMPWPPVYALVVLSLNAFSGATILVEFLRAKFVRLARMSEEHHFFLVSGITVAFLALSLSGYVMSLRSFEG